MTRAQWNGLVGDDEQFEVLFPDVARILGAPTTVEQRIAADPARWRRTDPAPDCGMRSAPTTIRST